MLECACGCSLVELVSFCSCRLSSPWSRRFEEDRGRSTVSFCWTRWNKTPGRSNESSFRLLRQSTFLQQAGPELVKVTTKFVICKRQKHWQIHTSIMNKKTHRNMTIQPQQTNFSARCRLLDFHPRLVRRVAVRVVAIISVIMLLYKLNISLPRCLIKRRIGAATKVS